VNEERMRTKTPGKQVTLSAMGIDVTPVVGSGTANGKEARAYINKGERTGRRTRGDETTGEWVVGERDGIMLHIGGRGAQREFGKAERKSGTGDGLGVL
jgi:hypothetical protein